MKSTSKLALVCAFAALLCPALKAENVTIDGKVYQMDRLIERQIAPGTRYLRLQFPEIPQNVNLVMVDLTNPYVGVENSVAKESAKGTELIASAATRLTAKDHKPVAGQNANFWAVSSQAPDGKMFGSQTRSISIRNGRIVTECNMNKEMAFGGPETMTGLLAISPEGKAYVDFCSPAIVFRVNDAIPLASVQQCNKGIHPDEIAMYNRFYGLETAFRPVAAELDANGFYQLAEDGDAYEVIADLADGESWKGGAFIDFIVKEVRPAGGKGTLGNHDLALVGRGRGRTKIENIKEGDKISLKYSLTFNKGTDAAVAPMIQTAIGGNILTMRNGELTSMNSVSSYDYNTYARSLYGTSADGKTLYMMVIDKSTDPEYGRSAGLSTAKASQIARHFGCANMLQCDGGGSAQMFVDGKVINKTTESTPRAVANCIMVFDNAPESAEVGSIQIDSPGEVIELPVGATFTPGVRVFNEYGSYLKDVKVGYTIECTEGLGTVSTLSMTASQTPAYGYITVKYRGKSVTRAVSVGGGQPSSIVDATAESATLTLTPSPVGAGESVTVEGPEVSTVEVYSVAGDLVSRVSCQPAKRQTISAPSVPGLYIVAASAPGTRATGKLLVI